MKATAIDAVGNALRDAGGRANTATLCARLPHLDRATIHQSLAHLKRRCIIDSDYAPARTPEGGWTYWFIARLTAVRGSRYRAAVSAGFTRVICEWLDAQGGEASIEAWREWSGNIANRIRLNSAIHSLRRRGLVEWGGKRVALTEGGKAALRTGRQVAPIAPRAEDFGDEPEIRQKQASTNPEASIARAEKLWPKLLAGRRYEDIPAHLIRPLAVLRWTPPISARSLTGSSGAMLAESRSTIGTTP